MQLWVSIQEVKETLVIEELGIPFLGLVVAEVISQGHHQDTASEQLGLLPVLVKQKLCPGKGGSQAG